MSILNPLIAGQGDHQPRLNKLIDALQDGLMQFVLIHAGRAVAVFRAELQTGDTPPDNALFAVPGPCASLIGRTALSAHQQLGQGVFGGVFALLGLTRFPHHLPLATPPGHLLPHLIKHGLVDDGGGSVPHRPWGGPLVLLDRLADAVGGIGLLQQGVANITLIGQDIACHLIRPALDAVGGGDTVCLQLPSQFLIIQSVGGLAAPVLRRVVAVNGFPAQRVGDFLGVLPPPTQK